MLLAKDKINKKEITQNLSVVASTIASIQNNQQMQQEQQEQQMQQMQQKKLEQQHKESQECYDKIKTDKEMIPIGVINNECIGYKETTDINGKINKEYIKK